jgi:AraC family transcriptional regulator
MTEREEEVAALQMPSAEFASVEQSTVDLASASITATGAREDVQPIDRRVSAELDNPILATVLLKLLNSAHQALAGERGQAYQFIERATALVSAEVQHREAAEHCPSVTSARSHLAPWQTRRAIEFVEANLAVTIRIEDLARVARLSASHFSKAFRLGFGESPYAYIVRRRIERAQEMMLLTDEPLASIAVACGLADQSHLTRLFHRIVGVSPASWRRSRRSPLQ